MQRKLASHLVQVNSKNKWDSDNKTGLISLTLLSGCCKMSYFLLKSNCFILTSLLFYFKGLCENFISYATILLNF